MEGVSLFVCIPLGTWSRYFSKIEEFFVTDQPAENAHKAKSCTSQILLIQDWVFILGLSPKFSRDLDVEGLQFPTALL